MTVMYCVCMHTFHSAHICIVYNSVKCVRYSYNHFFPWENLLFELYKNKNKLFDL